MGTDYEILDRIMNDGRMNSDWLLIRKCLEPPKDGIELTDFGSDTTQFVELFDCGPGCRNFTREMTVFGRPEGSYGETTWCIEKHHDLFHLGDFWLENLTRDRSFYVCREDCLTPVLFKDDFLTALGDYVVIEKDPRDPIKGDIKLSDRLVRPSDYGVVVSAGPGVCDLKADDHVLVPRLALCIKIRDKEYIFLREREVLGVEECPF